MPPWATGGSWWSVTRTADELSVVCPTDRVPAGVRAEGPWRAFAVAGPLDFALTGVLSALTAPLARAQVPVFTVSTFDTDYLLVRGADAERATAALTAAGHRLAIPAPPESLHEEISTMALNLISNVYVFETNPTQVAFIMESSDSAKLFSLTGFRVGEEGVSVLELNLQGGYTYQEQPVLWLQGNGSFGPTPPTGFTVKKPSKTQVLISDDFEKQTNEGTFVFRLQLISPSGAELSSDPTIVNRPIENGG